MSRALPAVALTAALLLSLTLVAPSSASASTAPITPGHLPYPASGTTAIGAGIDADNQNAQLSETLPHTITHSWKNAPPLCPEAGGVDASSIGVSGTHTVVVERQYGCSSISSYDTKTGAVQWRHNLRLARSATISGSLVYVQYQNPAGGSDLIDGIDIATGKTRWSVENRDAYIARIAVGSNVMVKGVGVYDAATGANRYDLTPAPRAETGGVSVVQGGRIIYNSYTTVDAYNPATGALLWSYSKASRFGPGGGIEYPSLHKGLLYVTNTYDQPESKTLVLDPATGKLVRNLPNSNTPIAFDGNVGIFTVNPQDAPSVVSAVNLTTATVYWTHRLDSSQGCNMTPGSAPLIENGIVWVYGVFCSGQPGRLFAFDEVSGATKNSRTEQCASAIGNLAISQHRLFVPSACGVNTYVAAK